MTTMIYITEPGNHDLVAYRGSTLYDAFTFYDTGGNAVDLTSWKAYYNVWPRNSAEGTSASLALTSTPAAGITLGGAAGTVIITATPTQTSALPAAQYDHQFKFEDAAGAKQIYYIGTLDLREDIP